MIPENSIDSASSNPHSLQHPMPFSPEEFSCEELLGPLNEVEAKYAPERIFAHGDTELLKKGGRVSIVGSRNASPGGLSRARRLAQLVCANGGVVISGLALGIDAAAHRGAIDAGGKTIGIIGTPLDRFYPKENADLQRLIMREHLCISQFSVGRPTGRRDFPIRNRTMALFSDATVIIRGGRKQRFFVPRMGGVAPWSRAFHRQMAARPHGTQVARTDDALWGAGSLR